MSYWNEPIETTTLDAKTLAKAVQSLRDYANKPYLLDVSSRYLWWKLIKGSPTVRNFSLYGGVPCYEDSTLPPNVARFRMSDGTYEDIKVFPESAPKFTFSTTP